MGVDHHDSGPFPVRSPAFFGAVLSAYTIWPASPHGLCAVGAFLSLSRLRRQLPRQRERKEQDADLEGTKRAQTGFGKTWRKGVQKAGSGGDVRAQELISDLLNLQSVGADVVTMHKVEAGFVFILPFF